MPKKPSVRTLMDSEHDKGSETLSKSSRQYFCQIFGSLLKKISSKNSVLLVSEILRLLVNILTPDDKYSLSVKVRVNATISNAIISKSRNILSIFFSISAIYIKFEILLKKTWAWEVFCSWNYRLQKAGLLKCPKSYESEHLWAVNMLKGPKHCINLQGSIFVQFFEYPERKSASKTLVW